MACVWFCVCVKLQIEYRDTKGQRNANDVSRIWGLELCELCLKRYNTQRSTHLVFMVSWWGTGIVAGTASAVTSGWDVGSEEKVSGKTKGEYDKALLKRSLRIKSILAFCVCLCGLRECELNEKN